MSVDFNYPITSGSYIGVDASPEELDAINSMLAALGESPLPSGTDLSTTGRADIDLAIQTLSNTAKEVLTEGWKFNTFFGTEIAPTSTVEWQDLGGNTTTLNVFKKPTGYLKWTPTACYQNRDLDLIESMSEQYTEGGQPVMVLYDRTQNRDGAQLAYHPTVFLDAVVLVPFIYMPETARRFITIRAARRFVQQTLGSDELRGFTKEDEMDALRLLKRDQGEVQKLNFLDHPEAWGWSGGRGLSSGSNGRRTYRGGI